MTFEHATPRPWILEVIDDEVIEITTKDRIENNIVPIATLQIGYSGPVGQAQPLNARLIVDAVNMHDELVTSLHNTYSILKTFLTDDDEVGNAVLDQAEALIAKAEGWNV